MPINLTIFDCKSPDAEWGDAFIDIPRFGKISTVSVAVITGLGSLISSFYLAKTTFIFSCIFGLAGVGAVFITKIFLDCFMKKTEKTNEIEMKEVKKDPLKRSFCTEDSYQEMSMSDEEEIARRRKEFAISPDDFVAESRKTLKRSPRDEKSQDKSSLRSSSSKMADISGTY